MPAPLLDTQPQPEISAMPQGGASPMPNVGTEAQDPNVDKAVMASLDLFYHPESIDAANQALQSADPAIAAGDMAAALIVQVDEKSGGNLPEQAIMPAGVSVLREIMDYAIEAGLHDFSAADEEAAVSALIQKLMIAYNTSEEQYSDFAAMEGQNAGVSVEELASNVASRGA